MFFKDRIFKYICTSCVSINKPHIACSRWQ